MLVFLPVVVGESRGKGKRGVIAPHALHEYKHKCDYLGIVQMVMVEGKGEGKTLDELTAGRSAVLGEQGRRSSVLNHKRVELRGCLHGDLVALCRYCLFALFPCLVSDSAR